MQKIARELERIIDLYREDLRSIPEEKMLFKPAPSKWSKKETIGHLVDSAQNNIRRFIISQYEDAPRITYNQDKWVAISAYQNWETADLIDLWWLLNKQICTILENISPAMAERTSQTEELHTIEWLAKDYNKHLIHHIHQVLDLEPVPYP